jgi:hypothetical protein
MTVVFQIAGKFKPDTGSGMAPAFVAIKAASSASPGHQRSLLLTNHSTLQFQMLFYWASYDEGLAFHTRAYPRASTAIVALVESVGTVVTSRLEAQLAPAQAAQETV